MKKKSRFFSAGEALDKFLKGRGFDENLRMFGLYKAWKELVGSKASGHSCPDQIQDDCLIVAVDNPVWSSELGFRKKEILDRIRDSGEGPVLKDIHFRIKKFRYSDTRLDHEGKK